MLYLDYSAKKTFEFCPWAWFEKYVNHRQARRGEGQRSDALTLGSLVHDGLYHWYRHHDLAIDSSVVDKLNPTPECLAEAYKLLDAYVRHYPSDPWTPMLFETPLSFSLFNWCKIVAKIDGVIEIGGQMQIPGGLNEEGIELEPGIYALEHKTKSADIDRGMYMKSWQTNLQADFQMLVLQNNAPIGPIRGVIVNVLEKPRPYVPKRVCKNCKTLLEMATYVATANGHMCPLCGYEQELSVGKGPRVERNYDCWRFLVTRTTPRLEQAKSEISQVAWQMKGMIDVDRRTVSPNRDNCCIPRLRKTCEYFTPHLYMTDTMSSDFEDTKDYVGEGMVGWKND